MVHLDFKHEHGFEEFLKMGLSWTAFFFECVKD